MRGGDGGRRRGGSELGSDVVDRGRGPDDVDDGILPYDLGHDSLGRLKEDVGAGVRFPYSLGHGQGLSRAPADPADRLPFLQSSSIKAEITFSSPAQTRVQRLDLLK